MIKVLILTTSFPLTPKSNSGVFVLRLAQALSRQCKLSVIAPADNSFDNYCCLGENPYKLKAIRYAPKSCQILCHKPGGLPALLKKRKSAYFLVPLLLLSLLYHCLKEARDVDIIHANWSICGLIGGLCGILLQKPVITTLRGDDANRAQKSYADSLILKWSVSLSSKVICVSQEIQSELIESYPVHKNKILFIPNGVDNTFLSLHKSRTYQNVAQQTFKILTIGSLIPRKNIALPIHALSALPDHVELFIAGQGQEESDLMQTAEKLGIKDRVHFLGSVPPTEIPDLFKHCDVFVLSSTSEGRPNVIYEAMASGLPIVASDIPGTRELIQHLHSGLLFSLNQPESLSFSIQKLIENPSLRKQLGTNAAAWIVERQLFWKNAASQYMTTYQSLIL